MDSSSDLRSAGRICAAGRGLTAARRTRVARKSKPYSRSVTVTTTSKQTRPPFRQSVRNPVRPVSDHDHAGTGEETSVHAGNASDQAEWRRRKGFRKDHGHPVDTPAKGSNQRVGIMTPAERTLRARLAAHSLQAKVDSTAHTEPARRAFADSFEKQVDPDGILSPEERKRRAEQARKAYFTRLAFKSVRARRERSGLE
jgi:hypothetical protein